MNECKPLFSEGKFDIMFDQAMERALKDTYQPPLFTDEQIMISWELVRQQIKGKTSNSSSED